MKSSTAAVPLSLLKRNNWSSVRKSIGNAEVVLIGEASHGTEEFYRIRADITKQLIEKEGFNFVAVEGDWPDVYNVNRYVQNDDSTDLKDTFKEFTRFPQWMWRNKSTVEFANWLRNYNSSLSQEQPKVGIYGLDLYSLFRSAECVINFLKDVNPVEAQAAEESYSVLSQFRHSASEYALAVLTRVVPEQSEQVTSVLTNLLTQSERYLREGGFIDGDELFFTTENARVVRDAEEYYRKSIQGGSVGWNLRDTHMFHTLLALRSHYRTKLDDLGLSPESQPVKCVVWAHNSHVGDERASEQNLQGQINIGQLVREEFGEKSYIVGFSTFQGTVRAASSGWGTPGKVIQLNEGLPGSYEDLLHQQAMSLPQSATPQASEVYETTGTTSSIATPGSEQAGATPTQPEPSERDFALCFRTLEPQPQPSTAASGEELDEHKLEGSAATANLTVDPELVRQYHAFRIFRFVGVQYLKYRERSAHYIKVRLAQMFNLIIHVDETNALIPMDKPENEHQELDAEEQF